MAARSEPLATESNPLATEPQSPLKQSRDDVVISRSTCKIITCLVVLFVIADIAAIAVYFSIVLEEESTSTSTEKRVVGSMPVVGPFSPIVEEMDSFSFRFVYILLSLQYLIL